MKTSQEQPVPQIQQSHQIANEDQQQPSTVPYDSNPFTISFSGFSNLITYAKGVFITMFVFGILSVVMNAINQFSIPASDDSSGGTTQDLNKAYDTLASTIDKNYIPVESDFDNSETFTNSNNADDNNDPTIAAPTATIIIVIVFVFFIAVLFIAAAIIINTAYSGFIAAGVLAANEKRMITFGEAFNEMVSRFKVLFVALLIAALRTIGGYLLFIVPGVRAGLRYASVPYIVMSRKDLSATESVNLAKSLYNGHLLEVFGIMTVGSIIPIIGQALSASGLGLSLKQITAYRNANLATPKTHWLNYLGLILVLLFIIIIITAMVLLAIVYSTVSV